MLKAIAAFLVVLSFSLRVNAAVSILNVTFTGPYSDPTVNIVGTGFGALPTPVSSDPLNGSDFNFGQLQFNYPTWEAGAPGNSIGLIVDTYSDSEIAYSFGYQYGDVFYVDDPTWRITPGSTYNLQVMGSVYLGVIPNNVPEASSGAVLLITGAALVVRRKRRQGNSMGTGNPLGRGRLFDSQKNEFGN